MYVSIEGNIGVGKTTLIEKLMKAPEFQGYSMLLEPIDVWQTWLHEMYRDPKRWSFFFNLKVLLTLSSWRPRQEDKRAICERSPLACKHVFSRVQHRRRELSDNELELLDEAHAALGWEPDVVVYLRATPDECLERMRKRGRPSEAGVGRDYLAEVHDEYEKLLMDSRESSYRVIVVQVGSKSSDDVLDEVLHELEGTLSPHPSQ